MKGFVIFIAIFFVHNCEALHGHPWLRKNVQQPTEAVVVTESAVVVPEPVAPTTTSNQGSGFALSGNIQGLLKNHRFLSKFHGSSAQVEPQPAVVAAPADTQSSGFSLTGNIQGLIKNHRLLSHFNKNSQATSESPIDVGFDDDSTGYSVSTSNFDNPEPTPVVAPQPVPCNDAAQISSYSESSSSSSSAIQQPTPIVEPTNNNIASGTASLSLSGGQNIHKILGDVVGLKVKLLRQAQNQISGRFDNHIKNLDKLSERFNQNSGGSSHGGSLHGAFSLHGKRY